jgi:hypothetical protein
LKPTNSNLLRIIHESYRRRVAENELRLIRDTLGDLEGELKTMNPEARIALALLLGRRGEDPFTISRVLNWQDFESLVAKACEENGYKTRRNLRIRKPRTEIDVLAVSNDSQIALCIDCKHWARSVGERIMNRIAELQVGRAERFLSTPSLESKPNLAIPVITTLFDESARLSSNVPIVPIFRFKDFLLNLRGNLNVLRLVGKNSNFQDVDCRQANFQKCIED